MIINDIINFTMRASKAAKFLNIKYTNISDKNMQEVSNQLLSLWKGKVKL